MGQKQLCWNGSETIMLKTIEMNGQERKWVSNSMGEEGKVMLFRRDRGIKNSDQGGISGSEE